MSKQVPRYPPRTGFFGCFTQPAVVSVCPPAWIDAQRSSPKTSNAINVFILASILFEAFYVRLILLGNLFRQQFSCHPDAARKGGHFYCVLTGFIFGNGGTQVLGRIQSAIGWREAMLYVCPVPRKPKCPFDFSGGGSINWRMA